jgi:hypothetical protein
MRTACCAVCAVLLASANGWAPAQTNPAFTVNLLLDYESAEQSVALFQDQPVSTGSLAALRGNRIAASTTGLIAEADGVISSLVSYLDSLKYHQIIRDDVYHLEAARRNTRAIQELLREMNRRGFSSRVAATVEQIFPADASLSLAIPVYVVAFGHQNVDAYVRRIVWRGTTPQFVGEGEGELTIVVNLAQSVDYGKDIEERFTTLLGVVAHEVFHAAFSAYKQTAASWQRYVKDHRRPFDELLDLTQNEGIAYYLSIDQRGRGYLPQSWGEKFAQVFDAFNANAGDLLSPVLPRARIEHLLRTANLSGFWESYGAMTGMFIARQIDLGMGRAALIETVARDPFDFFRKYVQLTRRDTNLPKLSPRIEKEIPEN